MMNAPEQPPLPLPPAGNGDTFPWPMPNPNDPGADTPGSSTGIAIAMSWPDLTPAERCAAIFIGDGMGGPGNAPVLARALGITDAECARLLWALLQKGFLQAVARWWAE